MKSLIIIPGNSKHNKEWADDLKEHYSKKYHSTAIHYEHWQNDSEIDLEKEKNKIDILLGKAQNPIIIAKSIGIILALQSKNIIKAEKILLCGVPLNMCRKNNIEITLNPQILPHLTIIQKSHDPAARFSEVKKHFPNANVEEIEGDDHSYPRQVIEKYIS